MKEERFRVLPGLPGTGPYPEQFSAGGRGTHREGFVVEFLPDGKAPWVGNFQPGFGGCSEVPEYSRDAALLVIALGQAYVIDLITRGLIWTFGGSIYSTLRVDDLLITDNGLWLEAWGRDGERWRTRRLSWDGFEELHIESGRIKGEAWSAVEDVWKTFSVDLATGEAEGGAYDW